MVFQNYALYPHVIVGRDMAFGLGLPRMPKADIAAGMEEGAKCSTSRTC